MKNRAVQKGNQGVLGNDNLIKRHFVHFETM